MPDYPISLPTLPTLTAADYPRAQDINIPNREIESICAELGVNPRVITDDVTMFAPSSPAPAVSPVSVAAYLDMLANIVKSLSGADYWYNAAVPSRCAVSGHGNEETIPAGATRYLYWFGRGLSTAAGITRLYVPWNANLQRIGCQILTAQPATGNLAFVVYSGTTDTGIAFNIAADDPAMTVGSADDQVYDYDAGDPLVLEVTNNASAASAKIGGCFAIFNQTAE
jgi:hypothetical protein